MKQADTGRLNLEAIRRRCRAAFPGAWGANGNWVGPMFGDPEKPLAELGSYGDLYNAEANAIFIACARQDVPALLAEVERLRGERLETFARLGEVATERDDWKAAEQKLAEMYHEHATEICEAIGVKWQPLDGRPPESAGAYPIIAVEAIKQLRAELAEAHEMRAVTEGHFFDMKAKIAQLRRGRDVLLTELLLLMEVGE